MSEMPTKGGLVRKGVRWKDRETISGLAIVETVLATSITILVVFLWDRWDYLVTAVVIAPFLLLRTKESMLFGIRLYYRLIRWLPRPLSEVSFRHFFRFRTEELFDEWRKKEKKRNVERNLLSFYAPRRVLGNVAYYCLLIALSFFVRVAATIAIVVRHPLISIRSIPGNWKYSSLIIDSRKKLEIIPGVSRYPHTDWVQLNLRPSIRMSPRTAWSEYSFSLLYILIVAIYGLWKYSNPRKESIWTPFILLAISILFLYGKDFQLHIMRGTVLITYLAGMIYRYSLKCTAIVWLPLLYIADDVAPAEATVDKRLDRIAHSAAGRLARAYALIVGLVLVAKFVVQFVSYKFLVSVVRDSPWLASLEPLVEPIRVPLWQVLSIANAIIAWLIYLYVDNELGRRKWGKGLSDETVENVLGTTILVKWVITVYTTLCTLYIIIQIAKHSQRPPFYIKFLPWL